MSRKIWTRDSLARRVILLAFTTVSLSLLVAGSLTLWNFQKVQDKHIETYFIAHMDMLVAATKIIDKKAVISDAYLTPLNSMPLYWQVLQGDKVLARSSLLKAQGPVISHSRWRGNSLKLTLKSADTKVIAMERILQFPEDNNLTYLLGMPVEIVDALIEESGDIFLYQLVFGLTIIALFMVIIFAAVQVRAVIIPLREVKDEVAAIHSGNCQRIEGSYPNEIKLLGNEINLLLEHNTNIIKRYQTFASNLSHALKTPLTILYNDAQTSSSVSGQSVREKTEVILGLIDRNLARVRLMNTDGMVNSRISLTDIARKTADSFGKLYKKEIEICMDDEGIFFQASEADIYEMLGNIIENACKYGERGAKISMKEDLDSIQIIVEDDGPGIPEGKREQALYYGIRLDEKKPGTGIGLAVSHDIIEMYGGNITLGESKMGGLSVLMTIPVMR